MLSSLCECDLHLNESSWWRHEVQSVVFKHMRPAASVGSVLGPLPSQLLGVLMTNLGE